MQSLNGLRSGFVFTGKTGSGDSIRSKVFGEGGERFGEGEGNLSLERFPFPLHFFLYFTSFLNHEIGCMDGSFV